MKKFILLFLLHLLLLQAYSQSQNRELIDHIIDYVHKSVDHCDYYEVTEEMFKSIAEDPRFQSSEKIDYIKKIEYVIYVECKNTQRTFYENFISGYNLKGFKVLMRTKSNNESFTFYKNSNDGMNEYLLIQDRGLSYVKTSLNISTLNEMGGIIRLIGELGG